MRFVDRSRGLALGWSRDVFGCLFLFFSLCLYLCLSPPFSFLSAGPSSSIDVGDHIVPSVLQKMTLIFFIKGEPHNIKLHGFRHYTQPSLALARRQHLDRALTTLARYFDMLLLLQLRHHARKHVLSHLLYTLTYNHLLVCHSSFVLAQGHGHRNHLQKMNSPQSSEHSNP